jgi:hypothetical protein
MLLKNSEPGRKDGAKRAYVRTYGVQNESRRDG